MNGTKVVIVDIFKYTIVVSPITCLTQRYIVPRITFNFHLRGTIEITRRQFPLKALLWSNFPSRARANSQ
jgi:hypothetical protein